MKNIMNSLEKKEYSKIFSFSEKEAKTSELPHDERLKRQTPITKSGNLLRAHHPRLICDFSLIQSLRNLWVASNCFAQDFAQPCQPLRSSQKTLLVFGSLRGQGRITSLSSIAHFIRNSKILKSHNFLL